MTEKPFESHEELNTGEEEVDAMLADYKELKAAKAAEQQIVEKKEETKSKKNRLPLLLCLLPIFLALTVWNAMRISDSSDPISSQDEVQAAHWSIFMMVDGIETFRESTGNLPILLETIGLDDELVEYELLGKIYSLTTTVGDTELVYYDGDDLTPFMDSYSTLMAGDTK